MCATYRVWGAWLAVLLASGVALAQRPTDIDAAVPTREVLALTANDGRNHEIEAIAWAPSGAGNVVYLVERVIDLFGPGVIEPGDGEFLLWKLDGNGKVLSQEFIGEVSNLAAAWVTIVPLPAPRQGAILIGNFDDRVGWSMLRIDGKGKVAGTVELGRERIVAAALLRDSSGLLLVGQQGLLGNVRKVDLDGKLIWEKAYTLKGKENGEQVADDDNRQPAAGRPIAQFYSIALTDEPGGFVVAGDFGVLTKFGTGQRIVWLLRCDPAGKVVSKSSFPGRQPAICPVGAGQFAVLYDTGTAMEFAGRVRLVDQQLEQQWLEKNANFTTFFVFPPAIAPIASNGGFVLAGNDLVADKEKKTARRVCRIDQYNSMAVVVSSVSIPIARKVMPRTRVASGADRVYAAFQTKGLWYDVGREASVYEIRLVK